MSSFRNLGNQGRFWNELSMTILSSILFKTPSKKLRPFCCFPLPFSWTPSTACGFRGNSFWTRQTACGFWRNFVWTRKTALGGAHFCTWALFSAQACQIKKQSLLFLDNWLSKKSVLMALSIWKALKSQPSFLSTLSWSYENQFEDSSHKRLNKK